MIKNSKLLIILLFTGQICFGQTDSNLIKVVHYKTNNFDVAIFSANYPYELLGQRFTPTRKEINKAEFALKRNLKELNKELIFQDSTLTIHDNLKKYKRQYFGYIDENGHRILMINCFWGNLNKDFNEIWLKQKIEVCGGGHYFWYVKYNIDTEELFELEVNCPE